MDALGLDERRDAETRLLLNVLLGLPDVVGEPLVGHRNTDVKRASPVPGAPFEAGPVELVGSLIHPVADVSLEKLRSFLLDGHPRKQIGNTIVHRGQGVLVDGIAEIRPALTGSQRGWAKEKRGSQDPHHSCP